jgi:hypothetical protein
MATATASWVRGILGMVQGGVVGSWHCGGFGLSRGVVGFGFAYTILHILYFYEYNIVRPVLREILYT